MNRFELVVGLETHVELSTKTKIFCSCPTTFGGKPNTNCCPICTGMPGTLPVLNRMVVEYAVLAGMATNCTISSFSYMDRKNYCYPDLPKAYQITQQTQPICENGWLDLDDGTHVVIERIHIEEDAGKLTRQSNLLLLDYNRCGIPLLEIVTKPTLHTVEQVRAYLEKLRLILRHLGISDCKMQEGSFRCDVNISVRPYGSVTLGTRAEIKNMNSFSFIQKAIQYEYERQCALIEQGLPVVRETRRFDESTGQTQSMRSKEDAHDYRFFREPDLGAVHITAAKLEELARRMPELPAHKERRYIEQLGLTSNDARLLCRYKEACMFFEEAINGIQRPQTIASLILGPIFAHLAEEDRKEAFVVSVKPIELTELVRMMEADSIHMHQLRTVLEQKLSTGQPLAALLASNQPLSEEQLRAMCRQVLSVQVKAVSDFRAGKKQAIKALMGAVLKAARGQADPAQVQRLLNDMLCKN